MLSHICRPHVPILCEVELGSLMIDIIRLLLVRHKTISHSVIVSTEDKRELLELQGKLVELVQDFRLLVKGGLDGLVHASCGSLLYLFQTAELGSVSHVHSYFGPSYEKIAVMHQRIVYAIAGFYHHLKLAVRRSEHIVIGLGIQAHGHEHSCQNGHQFMHSGMV